MKITLSTTKEKKHKKRESGIPQLGLLGDGHKWKKAVACHHKEAKRKSKGLCYRAQVGEFAASHQRVVLVLGTGRRAGGMGRCWRKRRIGRNMHRCGTCHRWETRRCLVDEGRNGNWCYCRSRKEETCAQEIEEAAACSSKKG